MQLLTVIQKEKVDWRVIAAFFAIYFLWGSTFLSIRVAVEEVPPLFAAGARFLIAGLILYCWSALRGRRQPTARQWKNLTILGALMFLGAYSGLFWAEKSVSSGVASVLVATIPAWAALIEIFIFKRQKLQWTLMAVLQSDWPEWPCSPSDPSGGGTNRIACLAIVASEVSWSLAQCSPQSSICRDRKCSRLAFRWLPVG